MNKKTGNIGKGKAGPGRPKGAQNKTTKEVKEMVIAALEQAGGVLYLVRQAEEKPAAFLSLVGKVLPLQLTGKDDGPIEVKEIRLVPMVKDGD